MSSYGWLEKRKPFWTRLESLVERATRNGLRALGHSELQELGLLYRQTATDLATVRQEPGSERVAVYLNGLLGRSHNLVYTGHAEPRGIGRFYREVYPGIFRAALPYTLLAAGLFVCSAVVSFVVALADPTLERLVLSAGMRDSIERRQMWTHSILSVKPAASSMIMTNNLSVSFMTCMSGITGGVGTAYFLVMNGFLMGVIAAACARAGMSLDLWSFVAGHGVLEIPAIFVAGGAGLLIARGLLFPGLLSRRASLERAGGQATLLLLGVIPMLIVAGIIEGYVSPTSIPAPAKFALAAVLGAASGLFFWRAGRGTAPAEARKPW